MWVPRSHIPSQSATAASRALRFERVSLAPTADRGSLGGHAIEGAVCADVAPAHRIKARAVMKMRCTCRLPIQSKGAPGRKQREHVQKTPPFDRRRERRPIQLSRDITMTLQGREPSIFSQSRGRKCVMVLFSAFSNRTRSERQAPRCLGKSLGLALGRFARREKPSRKGASRTAVFVHPPFSRLQIAKLEASAARNLCAKKARACRRVDWRNESRVIAIGVGTRAVTPARTSIAALRAQPWRWWPAASCRHWPASLDPPLSATRSSRRSHR